MRVAILGSRKPGPGMEELILRSLPENTTELVTCAPLCAVSGRVAKKLGLYLTKFLPCTSCPPAEAEAACLRELLSYCDLVSLFWDGTNPPARELVLSCLSSGKPLRYTHYSR